MTIWRGNKFIECSSRARSLRWSTVTMQITTASGFDHNTVVSQVAPVRGATERQRKQQSKPDTHARAHPPPWGLSRRDASPGRERGQRQDQSHGDYPPNLHRWRMVK